MAENKHMTARDRISVLRENILQDTIEAVLDKKYSGSWPQWLYRIAKRVICESQTDPSKKKAAEKYRGYVRNVDQIGRQNASKKNIDVTFGTFLVSGQCREMVDEKGHRLFYFISSDLIRMFRESRNEDNHDTYRDDAFKNNALIFNELSVLDTIITALPSQFPRYMKTEAEVLQQKWCAQLERARQAAVEEVNGSKEKKTNQRTVHYFGFQDALIRDLSKTALPRTQNEIDILDLIEQCCKRCAAEDAAGYIVLRGMAGCGKTVQCARICHCYDAVHHFIGQAEYRDDESMILKSLIEQMNEKMGMEEETLPDDQNALQILFEQTLNRYSDYESKQKETGILVIDGAEHLNLSDPHRLPAYLPSNIPDHIIMVISAGSDTEFTSLHVVETISLESFSLMDTRNLASITHVSVSESDLAMIQSQLHGMPSKIDYFFRNYEQGSSVSAQLEKLKHSSSVYDAFFDSLQDGSEEKEKAFEVLSLLAEAQGSIPYPVIRVLVSTNRRQDRSIRQLIRRYTAETADGVSLIDDAMRAYLNGNGLYSLNDVEKQEWHQRIIAYYQNHRNEKYAVECLGADYLMTGDEKGLLAWLLPEEVNEQSDRKPFIHHALAGWIADGSEQGKKAVKLLLSCNEQAAYDILLEIMQILIKEKGSYRTASKILSQMDQSSLTEGQKAMHDILEAQLLHMFAPNRSTIQNNRMACEKYEQILARYDGPMKAEILTGEADCLRELGDVMEADQAYRKACELSRNVDDYTYYYAASYVNDRGYLNGRLKETLENDHREETYCREHYYWSLLLRYFKVDIRIYNDICAYDKAIEVLHTALNYCSRSNNEGMFGELYNLLAVAQLHQSPAKALKTAEDGAAMNQKSGSALEYAKSMNAKGEALFYLGKQEEAEICVLDAVRQFEQIGYKSGKGRSLSALAGFYLKEGRKEEALQKVGESFAFLKRSHGYTHRIICFRNVVLKDLTEGKQISADDFKPYGVIDFPDDWTMNQMIESYRKMLEC